MSSRCLGITCKGARCQKTVKGDSYCHYHRGQRNTNPPTDRKRKTTKKGKATQQVKAKQTFAPLNETPFNLSPQIRELEEQQEEKTLTEIPLFEQSKGDDPVNIGVYQQETPILEDFLDIPVKDYEGLNYDELHQVTELLGFNVNYTSFPPLHPSPDEEEINRIILLSLINGFYHGDDIKEFLTEQGIENFNYAQEYFQGRKVEEEEKKEEVKEDCCVCFEEGDKLECNHTICVGCLSNLQKDACPVCLTVLKGKMVTPEIRQAIYRRQEEERQKTEDANRTIAQLLAEDEDADVTELYDIYAAF
jgi:hypothetical protein